MTLLALIVVRIIEGLLTIVGVGTLLYDLPRIAVHGSTAALMGRLFPSRATLPTQAEEWAGVSLCCPRRS